MVTGLKCVDHELKHDIAKMAITDRMNDGTMYKGSPNVGRRVILLQSFPLLINKQKTSYVSLKLFM